MSLQLVETIEADTLRQWLEEARTVVVLDVRPPDQRAEWTIPGSIHADVYQALKAGESVAFRELNLSRQIPIVTVCAAGRVSQVAAEQLALDGYQVYSLAGGMKAWSGAWNGAILPIDSQSTILQIRRTGKGCLSYLVGSDGEAFVIDPSVDTQVYEQLARQHGWTIRYVLETHLHADHLSRASQLVEATGATLILPQGAPRQYPFQPIGSGESLTIGSLTLQALATPGHTEHSVSYYLSEGMLFSGDTLFTNGVGRPDLHTHTGDGYSRAASLYNSLHQLLGLPGDTRVLPGHTASPVAFNGQLIMASLNDLKRNLPMLTLPEQAFVETILSRIPVTPPNYLAITERNTRGYFEPDESIELEAGANRCAVS